MSAAPDGRNFLKRAKSIMLSGARRAGAMRLVAQSGWRRRRLLILCYHGVSLDDEHQWNPLLYISRDTLRQRLELLRKRSCTVLPLDEAIGRLYDGTLPDRAVAITFDDGHHDFFAVAQPILSEFGVPVTVYLTTYHVDCNLPIFSLICSYMLWQARDRTVDLGIYGGDDAVALGSADARIAAQRVLLDFAVEKQLSAHEKNDVAAGVARQLDLDFGALCRRRVLHLMNADEVREVAASGVDFQLHSHCHRAPRSETAYREQISRNRVRVEQLAGTEPKHFCYPSGVTAPEFIPWLEAEGVRSATTTQAGFASPDSHPLLLPRILDHSGLSDDEIDGWLSGFSAFLPELRPTGTAGVVQAAAGEVPVS